MGEPLTLIMALKPVSVWGEERLHVFNFRPSLMMQKKFFPSNDSLNKDWRIRSIKEYPYQQYEY